MRAPDADLPIELIEVSFLAREHALVQHICLKLGPGRPTVLIGPNGSGKTTSLKLAMGLLQPTSGRITWGGRTDAVPVRRGYMFQRPVMLRRSVAANIAYALSSAATGAVVRRSSVHVELTYDSADQPYASISAQQDAQDRALIQEGLETVVLLLAPITPHICHVLWGQLGHAEAVIDARWPSVDESALVQDTLQLVVQVNGKHRGELLVPADTTEAAALALATAHPKIAPFIAGKPIKRVVYVPKKILNVVVEVPTTGNL